MHSQSVWLILIFDILILNLLFNIFDISIKMSVFANVFLFRLHVYNEYYAYNLLTTHEKQAVDVYTVIIST